MKDDRECSICSITTRSTRQRLVIMLDNAPRVQGAVAEEEGLGVGVGG